MFAVVIEFFTYRFTFEERIQTKENNVKLRELVEDYAVTGAVTI